MFIQYLQQDPQWYFMVVATVAISIVLHELAHGWSAIRCGDETPIHTGHMTGNPLVHMGPFSIAALFLCGIAWGQMPINPTRMRGRYAEALVAGAGPAMNLLLATVALTGLGLGWRLALFQDVAIQRNLVRLLFIFGSTNLLLCIFNLMPVPPLDGSHIVANFHRGYANLIDDPSKQGLFLMMFVFVFAVSGILVPWTVATAIRYTAFLAGSAQFTEALWGG